MKTKICSRCKIEREITFFRKEKRTKIGLQSQCKECEKKYREKNKQKQKKYMHEYYENNKEIWENQRRSIEFKKKKAVSDKKYRETHREIRNTKDKIRKEKDAVYRLKCNLRSIIKDSFRRRGTKKKLKGEVIIGCNISEMIDYLVKTYENNYNEKWSWEYLPIVHIDHIIPLATAKTEEDVIRLCHYTNLQLLKLKDNLQKRDKLDWRLEDDNTNM